jgi:hypothetical protein
MRPHEKSTVFGISRAILFFFSVAAAGYTVNPKSPNQTVEPALSSVVREQGCKQRFKVFLT